MQATNQAPLIIQTCFQFVSPKIALSNLGSAIVIDTDETADFYFGGCFIEKYDNYDEAVQAATDFERVAMVFKHEVQSAKAGA